MGSETGLFLPVDVERKSRIIITEGPTDCAAALDLGFAAIGRPNCNSKVDMTVAYCREYAEIIILGDNDTVGKTGAEKLAEALSQKGINVKIVFPPEKVKDLREWVNSGLTAIQLKNQIEGR